MASDQVDALVIFGATGDLAKLETFPALVGLVDRGVLDVPVIGVAKNGWGLEQFRDYAVASLKLNQMDPASPSAAKMLSLLRYVDGDLGDDATYHAMSDAVGGGRADPVLPRGAAGAVRPDRAGHRDGGPGQGQPDHGREAVRHRSEERDRPQRTDAPVLPGGRDLPGGSLAGPGPGGERAVRPVRQRDHRADAEPHLRGEHPDHHGGSVRRLRPGRVLRPHRRHPGRGAEPHAPGARDGDGRPAGRPGPVHLAGFEGPADFRDPPAHPGGDGPRPVRGLHQRAGRGAALDRGDVHRDPADGSTRGAGPGSRC